MAVCTSIKPNKSRVCIGDLNKKIKIQFSSSKGQNAPNVNAATVFSEVITVWALIKTTPVFEPVNGVNIENGVNTDFYIRYTSDIDFSKQIWVEFESNRFKVTGVDNIDKESRFVRLRSTERGSKTLGAAQR